MFAALGMFVIFTLFVLLLASGASGMRVYNNSGLKGNSAYKTDKNFLSAAIAVGAIGTAVLVGRAGYVFFTQGHAQRVKQGFMTAVGADGSSAGPAFATSGSS